jgi:small subunit ribosomal protein S9
MPKVKKSVTIKAQKEEKINKEKPSQSKKGKYYYATGRRKTAVARVRLYSGKGEVIINEKPFKEYLPTYYLQNTILESLVLTGNQNKFNAVVKTKGGGIRGQAEAIRLGIAKALLNSNKNLKTTLKKVGLLTRDPREKERKKYGRRGARRGRQFRKR